MYDIVAIGNPVYDMIRTPKLNTKEREVSGCSTNAAVFAASLGANVLLIGSIGRDYKSHFEKEMEKQKIETYLLPSRETGGFDLFYFPNGDRKLRVIGVADPIKDIPKKFLEAKVIFFGPVLQEISVELIKKIRNSTDAMIFVDPQGFIRYTDEERVWRAPNPQFYSYFKYIDFLKPNEFEAEIITGIYPLGKEKESLEKLKSNGVKNPIITLGANGSALLDGKNYFRISAYPTEEIDPTGAGDSYAGAFIYYYLKTGNILCSGIFASAAASFMVEDLPSRVKINFNNVTERFKEIDDACEMEKFL